MNEYLIRSVRALLREYSAARDKRAEHSQHDRNSIYTQLPHHFDTVILSVDASAAATASTDASVAEPAVAREQPCPTARTGADLRVRELERLPRDRRRARSSSAGRREYLFPTPVLPRLACSSPVASADVLSGVLARVECWLAACKCIYYDPLA